MLWLYYYELKQHSPTVFSAFGLFLLYSVLVPLILGLSPELINHFHSGVIWVCMLFCFLPERVVHNDFEDGTLEMYLLSNRGIQPILLSKLLGVWCLKVIGILCTFPILAIMYHFEHSKQLMLDFMFGSCVFTLICGIHSCFTIGIKNSWNLHHFTTLPTLLPLIMLCTNVSDLDHSLALVGLLSVFMWIYWVFVPLTLRASLSH